MWRSVYHKSTVLSESEGMRFIRDFVTDLADVKFKETSQILKNHRCLLAHSPVMCEIAISNSRKINLIIAYCFIFVLREEHLEDAFA